MTGVAQLRKNRPRLIDRHREPDVGGARADRRVDADHLAASVDQRPPAVAEIDRGVGLDVPVERAVEQLPSDEADDADRHRVLVGQRIANGDDPFAHTQRIGIAKGGERERPRGINLDERDIGIGVRADARRVQVPSIRQPHHDAIGAVNDVMIREDQTIGVDDEAGTGAAAWTLRIALAGTIEQLGAVGHRQAAKAAGSRRPA